MTLLTELKKTSMRGHGELIGRLLVDTEQKKLLCVPSTINHLPFLAIHVGMSIDELKKMPNFANRFVGVMCRLQDNHVIEIGVGVSGLEMEFERPFHTKRQVNVADEVVMDALQAENLLAPGFRKRVVYL